MTLPFSKALVTGGAGFVGSHITDQLVKEGVEVSVLDDFSSGKMSNLESSLGSKVMVIKGDINDKELTRRVLKDVEVVFHEAAIVSVQRSIEEPEFTNHVNIDGTRNMIQASADAGVKKFVFASSAAIYGDSKILPRKESNEPSPISPYASAKLEGERLCKQFYELIGMETVALRYFNIYGIRSTSKAYSGVINAIAQKLVAKEKPVVYGDGRQTRDFISVEDIVQANILAACSGAKGQAFNVGTGKQTTVLELVSLESKILLGHNSVAVDFKDARKGDVQKSYADVSLAREKLGYEPKITIEKGLEEYLRMTY
ncbi:MAG: GDP-mannose 4,6-dehydratase [Nitrososphaerales archaeon]